jgi:hypothetical protein
MLLNEHKALWNKIREFPLNEPGAAITFSNKLQEQQEWTASYTERVIEEYRKFIFLCCVAPKGASPSKAVDEAWHLHLTYTKSYWVDLCKNTLGRDIHHHPSKGGAAEDHKHEDWYKETLDQYRQAFGNDPPQDIWPPPFEEMDLPEPRFEQGLETNSVNFLILLVFFLIIAVSFGTFWPFDLTGPEFLIAYPLIILGLWSVHYHIEKKKEDYYEALVADHFETGATVFQQAKFLYGKHRAIQTALVDLLRRDLLEVRPNRVFVVHNKYYNQPENEENPLIENFLRESDGAEIKYDLIDTTWYDEEKFSHPSLTKLYRFAYAKKSHREKYMVNFFILLIGIARLLQGWTNGRPTGFLIMEILLLLIIGRYIQKNFSRVGSMFRKAENIFYHRSITNSLYKDDVVANFAAQGNNAIRWFAEGAILATVFASFGPIRHTNISATYQGYTSGDGGAGGCSSCGGGGGCGGGGCEGCGGGD